MDVVEIEVGIYMLQCELSRGGACSIGLDTMRRQRRRYRVGRGRKRMGFRCRNTPAGGRYASKSVSSRLGNIASRGCHASHFVE
jgi:hypothetical protein